MQVMLARMEGDLLHPGLIFTLPVAISGGVESPADSPPSLLIVALKTVSDMRRKEVVKSGSLPGHRSREAARPKIWKVGAPLQLQ